MMKFTGGFPFTKSFLKRSTNRYILLFAVFETCPDLHIRNVNPADVFIFNHHTLTNALMHTKIPLSFFLSHNVTELAQSLLGCGLWTNINGRLTAGTIVETEAYDGLTDRASHAYGGKRTSRTAIFYQSGGRAYIYLCYGIHTLFNIITGPEEVPQAILIRAVEPFEGIPEMLKRRNQTRLRRNTTGGPALVSQALGITMQLNGVLLCGPEIWLTHAKETARPKPEEIVASPRVGIDYAGNDAGLPWRFRWAASSFTSPAR